MTLKWPYSELNPKLGNRSKLIYDECSISIVPFSIFEFIVIPNYEDIVRSPGDLEHYTTNRITKRVNNIEKFSKSFM